VVIKYSGLGDLGRLSRRQLRLKGLEDLIVVTGPSVGEPGIPVIEHTCTRRIPVGNDVKTASNVLVRELAGVIGRLLLRRRHEIRNSQLQPEVLPGLTAPPEHDPPRLGLSVRQRVSAIRLVPRVGYGSGAGRHNSNRVTETAPADVPVARKAVAASPAACGRRLFIRGCNPVAGSGQNNLTRRFSHQEGVARPSRGKRRKMIDRTGPTVQIHVEAAQASVGVGNRFVCF